jgi:hypothetical protein
MRNVSEMKAISAEIKVTFEVPEGTPDHESEWTTGMIRPKSITVSAQDRGKELRSDSALVTWHAGDEQSYSHVHHGGKYSSEPIILGPGTHLLIIKIEVDTATETTCAIVLGGNVGNVKDTSATGRCSRSVTIVVK